MACCSDARDDIQVAATTASEVAQWCTLAQQIADYKKLEDLRRAESNLRDLLEHAEISQADLSQMMVAAQPVRYVYADYMSEWCESLQWNFEDDFPVGDLEYGTKPYSACEHITQLVYDGMYALTLSEFRREATADKLGEQFPAEHAAARWLGLASAETIRRLALSESYLHAAGATDIPSHVIQKLGDVMLRELRLGRSVDYHVRVLERLVRTCRIWAALVQAGAPTLELTKTLTSDLIDTHLSWYRSYWFDDNTPPCSCVKSVPVAGFHWSMRVPDVPEGNDDRIFAPRCNVLHKPFPSMLYVRDSCLMPYLAWRRRHAAVRMRTKISPQAL